MYRMNFEKLAEYDPGHPGITIPVTLKLVGCLVSLPAKLDTGSTDCIFARTVGEQLGLTIEHGRQTRIGTATGTFTAFGHEVTMNVLGYDFDVPVFFAESEFFSRNVLGRRGFLDHICLGLVDYEGKLYLSRYGDE